MLDVISRYWLSTVVSAEETSTQVELAFTRALIADGKEHLLEGDLLEELSHGVVPDNDDRVPVLLAVSDNGPQMTSKATAVFMAGARIAQHFGRPATPNDQAWIESFFGHLKPELPHLSKITDPGELEAELEAARTQSRYAGDLGVSDKAVAGGKRILGSGGLSCSILAWSRVLVPRATAG
ncbi:DDE-type integrase/transposase/recombinase [Serinicoccus sp. CUA-874]|uniref:DDE-type integrase/transposase/recombinase n=1 Tax=Serinicoccus sp. CUA-874 TaxID=1517939 RepID=UPI001300FA26|nr:DDE-type integrase/transposase/recombinase [Serinicoccus sp. CUA-874]